MANNKMGLRRQTVQILLQDGSMEVDTRAVRVGRQLISGVLGGAALPVRKPTPSYVHKELNRAPTKRSSVHWETSDPVAPDQDSEFVLRDSFDIWDSARQGFDTEADAGRRFNRWLQGICAVLATICLLVAIGIASQGQNAAAQQQQQQQSPPQQQYQAPAPTPPLLLPPVRR